jgi:hypothetical protein
MGARKDNLLLNGFCSFSNLIYIWAYSKEVIYGLHLGNDRPCEPKKMVPQLFIYLRRLF